MSAAPSQIASVAFCGRLVLYSGASVRGFHPASLLAALSWAEHGICLFFFRHYHPVPRLSIFTNCFRRWYFFPAEKVDKLDRQYYTEHMAQLKRNSQIAHPNKFDRYFWLDVDSLAYKTADIKNVIYDSDEDEIVLFSAETVLLSPFLKCLMRDAKPCGGGPCRQFLPTPCFQNRRIFRRLFFRLSTELNTS